MMPINLSSDKDIIEKIDAFIQECKDEIKARSKKASGKTLMNARQNSNFNLDKLNSVKTRRFGFNQCVKDCFGEKNIEAYKASLKRIRKGTGSEEDLKKLELLFIEMQKIYFADTMIEIPPIPQSMELLPKSLRMELRIASKYFDEQISKKDKNE